MDSSLKRAAERALQPAMQYVEEQIPWLKVQWPEEYRDVNELHDVPLNLVKPHIKSRVATIVARRRGRTLTISEKQDVEDYTDQLLKGVK